VPSLTTILRFAVALNCKVMDLIGAKQTVDALLAAALLDFVSVHSTWLVAKIPGFADALAWPVSARTASSA
jgi:hypothetical protein